MSGQQILLAQTYYVYANAESEDEVALIRFDGSEAVVEKTIQVGRWPTEIEGPHGITVAPDGAYWYLTMAHGNPYGTLYQYATGSDELIGSVELGLYPATMAVSPATGLLYAVNFNLHGDHVPSSISVVEPKTLTEIDQIETGIMPHGSRLSPDGLKHYSVAMMNGLLYELDADQLLITRTLFTGTSSSSNTHSAHHAGAMPEHDTPKPKPTWVVSHPDGDRLFVANNGSHEIVEVDLNAWEVSRRFPTEKGPYNLDISPDGKRLVVTHKGAASIGIIALPDGEQVATLPTSTTVTHGVVITPDSKYAFVTAEGIGGEPGKVDVFDLQAYKRVASVSIGKQAGGIAFWKMTP